MKVYGNCSNCKAEIAYSTRANTRVEFAMQDGENVSIQCKECATSNKFHVDELYAKESKIALLLAVLILFVGTPLMIFGVNPVLSDSHSHYIYFLIGGFLLLPVTLYSMIQKQDRIRVSTFNRNKLKERR